MTKYILHSLAQIFVLFLLITGTFKTALSQDDDCLTLQCKSANIWLNSYGFYSINEEDVIKSLTNSCESTLLPISIIPPSVTYLDLNKGPSDNPKVGQVDIVVTAMLKSGQSVSCTTTVTVHNSKTNARISGQAQEAGFGISSAHPNPFSQSSTITFNLPENGNASLNIFNSTGSHIKQLVNADLSSGYHTVNWDGSDFSGLSVNSGIYYATLKTGGITSSIVISLVK